MSSLMIWYEKLGGREQSEHVESIELWGRVWSIGDRVFSLYHGWGDIKAIWRLHRASGDKKHMWRCNAMFQSGEFENEALYSLNIWMTEDSFASERGEKIKHSKNVTLQRQRVQPRVTAPESVTRSDDQVKGIIRCVVCNAEMNVLAKRRHTKTCSPKCRKALSRKQT